MNGRLVDMFVPSERSVYAGREFLGRYLRTSPKRTVAYDKHGKQLGTFEKLKDTCALISAAHREGRHLG